MMCSGSVNVLVQATSSILATLTYLVVLEGEGGAKEDHQA